MVFDADARDQVIFGDRGLRIRDRLTGSRKAAPSRVHFACPCARRCWPVRSSPPSRSARSRMPSSPKWPPHFGERVRLLEALAVVGHPQTERRGCQLEMNSHSGWHAACFTALVTASCAMRNRCCSISSGSGRVLATSTSTRHLHRRSRGPLAGRLPKARPARSWPSSAEARRSITERRASVKLCRAILRARSRCLRARSTWPFRVNSHRVELRRNAHEALRQRVVNLPRQPRALLQHQREALADLPQPQLDTGPKCPRGEGGRTD